MGEPVGARYILLVSALLIVCVCAEPNLSDHRSHQSLGNSHGTCLGVSREDPVTGGWVGRAESGSGKSWAKELCLLRHGGCLSNEGELIGYVFKKIELSLIYTVVLV